MPIVDVQVVVEAGKAAPEGAAKALANTLAQVLQTEPGRVWVRLEQLAAENYAENGEGERVLPVFVKVLHADLPPTAALAAQALAMAQAVAACLSRNSGQVHIEYAPPGRGRVAFGGKLLR
jgi:phenylpyruvate tautomerase PptA (4-oxalocrotonate tautomerase family)